MRLFIAIQFNDEIREALQDMQDSMRELGVRGNYTKPENLHLTLAFIGEYPDSDEVLDAIERVRFKPFKIKLSETGAFDRLWWVGIEENNSLSYVVRQLRRALADMGIPFDKKKFKPHITLIRNPSSRSGLALADVIRRVPDASMVVDHISLMRSDRGKSGMVYTEITY